MNYRHIYHAGNPADLFKHNVIIALIEYLKKKDTAFCILDTHAGIGKYDLLSEKSQKTGEYKDGIGRLNFRDKNTPISQYFDIIGKYNNEELRFYPGSPLICRSFLRSQDRTIFCELHQDDIVKLKELFRNDKQITIHHMDGFQAIKAFLPFKQKRGLVIIDPAYDRIDRATEDYNKVIEAIKIAHEKAPQTIIAVWYPIKEKSVLKKFYQEIKNLKISGILGVEFIPDCNNDKILSSGIVIINPPWQIDLQIREITNFLLEKMQFGNCGKVNIFWLTGKKSV